MTAKKSTPSKRGAKAKRVALYLRVSTVNGQTVENQRRALKKVAEAADWNVVKVYQDEGISGAKGRDKRPGYDAMLKDATARQFDIIAAFALDRIGRSMPHLVSFLEEIRAVNVDLYIHDQRLDTSTPMGEMLFHIAGAFAQFERRLIRERVISGQQRAKAETPEQRAAKGKKPIGKPPLPEADRARLTKLRGKHSARETARIAGVSLATVIKYTSERRGKH